MFDQKKYMRKWREENKEYCKEYIEQWNKNNPEYYKKYRLNNKKQRNEDNKKWKEANKEHCIECGKKYRKKNKEIRKQYQKEWSMKNKEKRSASSKKWSENNPEKIREYHKKYCNEKYRTDLKFNINLKVGRAIHHSLEDNKNGRRWEDIVGYTLKDLIKHLKKTMPKEYVWQDYLQGNLHLDHIIPINAFNFIKSEDIDFKRCWSLMNLQLLPAKDNLIKGNKLIEPFQLALKI